jgi:mycothiol synthase
MSTKGVFVGEGISVRDAPAIPGLGFRRFCGEVDFPAMAAVIEGSKQADGIERTNSVEEIARHYEHLIRCDPNRDMLFAEMDGRVIGYSRVWWQHGKGRKRLYPHFALLLPRWRGKGIRRAMLRHNERRLRQIAADHPKDQPRILESWAAGTERHWESLLVDEGYEAVRYGFDMLRPHLDDVPSPSLPQGLDVRPVQPTAYRAVWEAAKEAFQDEWDYSQEDWSDDQFARWQTEPTFDPSLWQVAWDGDQVAGMVLSFVDHAENEEYRRKRGYTEGICVRRPWRRRGLARALIARSLLMLREHGMTEAALGVDADNPSGALRLYQSLGFRRVKQTTIYRKSLI